MAAPKKNAGKADEKDNRRSAGRAKTAGRAAVEERAEALAAPIARTHGVRIYDVDYAREGEEYTLCVYIDKAGGVTIDDCEAVSRLLSDALDKEDFIAEAYTLVVSSPGLGRKLTKDRHLAASIGEAVDVKGYKALGDKGEKEITGVLTAFDAQTIRVGEKEISRSDIALVRQHVDW